MTEPDPTYLDPDRPRHREAGQVPPTDIDPDRPDRPGRPRRRGGGDEELPATLAARFDVVTRLDAGDAGEARLYLVREKADAGPGGEPVERVLKVYEPARVPDERVREALVGRSVGPELVQIAESEQTPDGRFYEVMEYLPGGDLRALRAAVGTPSAELARDVVRQLAEAIHLLHGLGILHRDVKPGNVMLRSAPDEPPLRLALIDFGISRWLDGRDILRTRSVTIAYAAPEALMGRPDRASDWWSLGVLLYEFITGELPYDVSDPDVIVSQVAAGRPIDLDRVADPQLRLLCQGLRLHDKADRWGYDQIQDWLSGSPPVIVVPEPEEVRAAWPLPFYGEEAHTPLELAGILEDHWDRAASRFFGSAVGDPWWQLRKWLTQFDGSPGHRAAERKRLFKRVESTRNREPSHVLLLRLLCWLNPNRPPIYRGEPISRNNLIALAQEAIKPERPGVAEVVYDLQEYDVLRLLATTPGGAGLAEINERWRREIKEWDDTPRELTRAEIRLEPADSPGVRPYLLWMATGDPSLGTWLDRRIAEIGAELAAEVEWFTKLATAPDTMSRLRAVLLEREARGEANRLHEARVAEKALRAQRRKSDARIRWHRDQQRILALGWAAAGAGIVLIAWSWIIRVTNPFASEAAIAQAWNYSTLSVMVVLAGELSLALVMGGLYYHYRHFALFGTMVRYGSRALRPFRTNAWGALPIIVALAVGAVFATKYAAYLLPLLTGVAHLGWTLARHARWHREWNSLTDRPEQPDPITRRQP